jgi:hypothetical protein
MKSLRTALGSALIIVGVRIADLGIRLVLK